MGGSDSAEQDWLEFNARNLITLWGPNGEINDYAKKDWGGLVRGYYKRRWSLCIQQATADAPKWDAQKYSEAVFNQIERPFSQAPFLDFPEEPEADAIEVAKEMYATY